MPHPRVEGEGGVVDPVPGGEPPIIITLVKGMDTAVVVATQPLLLVLGVVTVGEEGEGPMEHHSKATGRKTNKYDVMLNLSWSKIFEGVEDVGKYKIICMLLFGVH